MSIVSSNNFLPPLSFHPARSGVNSPSEMEVMMVKDNSVTVRWNSAQGPILGYRVTGVPKNGEGTPFTEVVAPGVALKTLVLIHYNLKTLASQCRKVKDCFVRLRYRPDRIYFLWTDAHR